MSVLESMRSSTDSTGMQVLLVLIVISFVGWTQMPEADSTVAVAKVNGVSIMDTKYRQAYSIEKNRREAERGPLSDLEEKGMSEGIRQTLIRNEVLLQEAAAMGLVASHLELIREIVRNGLFMGYADDTGKLDDDKYERFLARRGLTRGAYENQLSDGILLKKVTEMVFMGTTISEPVLRQLFEQNQRKVAVTYARVRPSAFYSSIEVSPEMIETWLKENDVEAREIYARDFDRRYKHPERLELGLIRLVTGDGEKSADLVPRMNEIRQLLLDGADFSQLARKWSEDPSAKQGGVLGLKPVMKIDISVTDAVDKIKVGEITRVVPGDSDARIYKVLQRIDASEDTFEIAGRTIAKEEIRKAKAPEMAINFAKTELLPKWKTDAAVPRELLLSKGLTSQTTRLMAAADPSSPFGPPAEVMSKAMELSEGTVIDKVFESSGNYWVVQVSQRVDADMARFEAQRDTIRGQELLTRRNQFLESWITDRVANAVVE